MQHHGAISVERLVSIMVSKQAHAHHLADVRAHTAPGPLSNAQAQCHRCATLHHFLVQRGSVASTRWCSTTGICASLPSSSNIRCANKLFMTLILALGALHAVSAGGGRRRDSVQTTVLCGWTQASLPPLPHLQALPTSTGRFRGLLLSKLYLFGRAATALSLRPPTLPPPASIILDA
jgi:hypothetical protein